MAEKALVHRMEQAALTTKIRLLDLAHQTLIHIGGDLSVCDMMTAIWQYAMHYDVKDPHWEGRDRFVLSKGHAAAVTSFSQAAIGCYDVGDIYKEYATYFGRFGMHSCNLANPYVDVSTGSLGHGFPVASGMATALKRKGSSSRVYTVVGDGECGEGSIWEAAMYAHQYKLGNLVVFVDRNGMSFDGPTEEYMSLEPFADKWRAFGWNTVTIDGHDMNAILDAIDALIPTFRPLSSARPSRATASASWRTTSPGTQAASTRPTGSRQRPRSPKHMKESGVRKHE